MKDQLDKLYTPIDQAIAELEKRRSALGRAPHGPLEQRLRAQPSAVMFRQVATPNFELEHFTSRAVNAGLTPFVLEYHADRFVHLNSMKHALVRLRFSDGPLCREENPPVTHRIVDMTRSEGRALRSIVTTWGQPLVDFHHELIGHRDRLRSLQLIDGSQWFSTHGPRAYEYYVDFFSLFVSDAILFEDFLLTPEEEEFTSRVVLPGFEAAQSQHGLKPLICRLDAIDGSSLEAWLHYPRAMHPIVSSRLTGRATREDRAATDRLEY